MKTEAPNLNQAACEWATLGAVLAAGMLFNGIASAQDVLPLPPAQFKGSIGLSAKDSTIDFPKPVVAPKGSPNIVLVLLDDVGFGAASTFGGPCATPTLERLAKRGLRFTQFHTTALCSPTRAALLTGRNHHSVHTGTIMEMGTGFPGYDSLMGKDAATIAEILKQRGWNTAWFGKNHNVPDWQTSQAGPFDLWPTGLGFEHFYGFIGAETNQWRPAVFDGTKPIEPYLGNPDYNFDYDIADQAIAWVRNQKAVAPERPFFLYYAPGATHAPHQPRKEWIVKYAGRFAQGWDGMREETLARQKRLGIVSANTQLTPRHRGIAAWDSLHPDEKLLYAYMMEIYAGYLEQTDSNVGRMLDAIEKLGLLDNTLVIYIAGDNGASAEGGGSGTFNEIVHLNGIDEGYEAILRRKDGLGKWYSHNHYPIGWAHAMDTPFQWTKQIASHYGATRNAMVISWPAHIKDQGGIRSQWHHTIDIVPTILEVCGLQAPSSINGVAQKPIEGVSMAYCFENAKLPSARRTQYFEMFGNRAIYHDGWVACTTPKLAPWEDVTMVPAAAKGDVISGYNWELYHVAEDFSEAFNLADQYRDKLRELQLLFYAEAAKYNVLPLDDSKIERIDVALRPSLTAGRTEFTYLGSLARIPEAAAPDLKNKSFRITAEVTVPGGGGQGVVVTQGGMPGGWALLLQGGKPAFHYNTLNLEHFTIATEEALSPGKHVIVFDFHYDGGGIGKGGDGTLSVDGRPVVQGRIGKTVPLRFSCDETFDVGQDTGTPVTEAYDVPFMFTGRIEKVVIQLGTPGPVAVVPRTAAIPKAPGAEDAARTSPSEHHAYGAAAGAGISLRPDYLPTPSVKNKNNYFPQSEPLGPDEMRITFMGSNPWPPRVTQAATCMMVELGGAKRLFFDFGPGCLRNIVANQVPVPEINDIFLTHLHIDHCGELPYLWQFAPFNGRWKPLRVIGPSGRTPELGTTAMCDAVKKLGAWTAAWAVGPMSGGYEFDITEFDYRDDGGVCYDKDGVKVTHWRRSHMVDGASAYRLDWNGLSFVWTGDGKPDQLTARYAKGADVFVTEMVLDVVNLWALKQGVSPIMGAFTIDNCHTTHYAAGYLANLVQPRLAMATHFSYDRELIGELMAGVRTHYKGMFALGIDGTVVNVTKDRFWIREAALPETTNTQRPGMQSLLRANFDGRLPGEITIKNPVLAAQEQSVRNLEIDPALFTPKDQMRQWVRASDWPPEVKVNITDFLAEPSPDITTVPSR